jgi:hypothetical protein
MKTAILPLIVLLSGAAQAQVDTVTLTGMTNGPFVNGFNQGGPSFPFSVSFTVDTQSGTYSSQLCPITPTACGFSASNLTVTNAHGTINGIPVQVNNGPWGGGGSGPFSAIFGGIGYGDFGPVSFNWGFDISTLALGPNPTLDQIIRTPGSNDQSFMDGFGLEVTNVSVTSVPEPGTLSLLALALTALLLAPHNRKLRRR